MVKKAATRDDNDDQHSLPQNESSGRSGLLRKKPWTEEEDLLVRRLVEKYGPQRWSFIAKFVSGRQGKQCR